MSNALGTVIKRKLIVLYCAVSAHLFVELGVFCGYLLSHFFD